MDSTKELREELSRISRTESSHQKAEFVGMLHGVVQTVRFRPAAQSALTADEQPAALEQTDRLAVFMAQSAEQLAELSAKESASEETAALSATLQSTGKLVDEQQVALQQADQPSVVLDVFIKHGAVARRFRSHCKTFAIPITLVQQPKSNLKHSGGYSATIAIPLSLWQNFFAANAKELVDPKTFCEHWNEYLPLVATIAPTAYLAGLTMTTCSLSKPYQPVHFQLIAPNLPLAHAISQTFALGNGRSKRIVVKHGEKVANVLKTLGALVMLENFTQGRDSLELRKQANRATNADRANLNRTSQAAGKHIQAIQGIVDELGWDAIPEDLQNIALARLVNPEATLIEIGELMQPSLSKAATHRRLNHLVALYKALADEP